MEWILVALGLVYLVVSPFTKVEESFNLQATHDILFHFNNISQYDHLEFAGVVPRTFLGPLVLAVLSSPFVYLVTLLGLSKFICQYIVRAVLGSLVIYAFSKFRSSIKKEFGSVTATWFILVTASQFHFNYYLSRTLPNSFALILVLLAYHYWLDKQHTQLIVITAAAAAIFRFEAAILLSLFLLLEIVNQRLSIVKLFHIGIPAGVACIALSFMVDSYFWQRPVWPEGEVFWFNVILNKSSNYGTSPFFWYFYSAIPRALALNLFLLPYTAIRDKRCYTLLFPAVGYVLLFSFLPHKELRFIIYTFPLFNLVAARTCTYIWSARLKSLKNALLVIVLGMVLLMNMLSSCMLLYISSFNYPGGEALARIHELEDSNKAVHIHLDQLTAETGASRFGEINPSWKYSKTEGLELKTKLLTYTHLLVENTKDLDHLTVLDQIFGFSHIHGDYTRIPPVVVEVKPMINIIKVQEQFTKVIIETKKYASSR